MGVLQEIDAATNLAAKTKRGILEKCGKRLKYRKFPFYYNNYNKKTFVDQNGNGVVFVSFDLMVVDKKETSYIKIKMDISDSQYRTKFPSFNDMKKERKTPFKEFWFDVWSSSAELITAIKEDYDVLSSSLKSRYKNSKKHLCIKVSLNNNMLKQNVPYKISYIFSIPGMFPLKGGYYDTESSFKHGHDKCVSSMDVEDFYEKCKISLYLSKRIILEENVKGFVAKSGVESENLIEVNYEDYGFYTKNIMIVPNSHKYRNIGFKWKVKNI